MSAKSIFLSVCLVLMLSMSAYSADIYIDSTANDPAEDGTVAHPYNALTDFTLTRGNNYYFKGGSSFTVAGWTINTAASGTDVIYFGAYLGAGVHEEDTGEAFGILCSDAATAKPIFIDSDLVGNAVTISANYLTFNSLQFKKGNYTISAYGSNNRFEYCYIGEGNYGIWFGSGTGQSDHYYGYNYFQDTVGGGNYEGLLLKNVDSSIIEYNVFDGWGHNGIFLGEGTSSSDSNIVRYNKFLNTNQTNSEAITVVGDSNQIHHNYMYRMGLALHLISGLNNEFYGNIIVGSCNTDDPNKIINMQPLYAHDITGNKVYNNTLYSDGSESVAGCDTTPHIYGIQLYCNNATYGYCNSNTFANNILLNFTTYTQIRGLDTVAKLDSSPTSETGNKFLNNCGYNYYGLNYAKMENTSYASVTAFNDAGTNYNDNIASDPLLEDPASGEFWPTASSPLVGAGYTVSSTADQYNKLFTSDTDFSTNPITVSLVSQPATWTIGAFGLPVITPTGTIYTGLGGSNVNEAHIRAGLDADSAPITIIYTLVGGATWAATIGADNAISTAFLAGITCTSAVQTAGFAAQVAPSLDYTCLNRNADNVTLTLTVPACASYDLDTGNETWQTVAPANSNSGAIAITAIPDITISKVSDAAPAGTGGMVQSSSGPRSVGYSSTGAIKIVIGQ